MKFTSICFSQIPAAALQHRFSEACCAFWILSRSGGEKGPRCSGTGNLGVLLESDRCVEELLWSARGSASWLSSHGRGLGPRDVLKKAWMEPLRQHEVGKELWTKN